MPSCRNTQVVTRCTPASASWSRSVSRGATGRRGMSVWWAAGRLARGKRRAGRRDIDRATRAIRGPGCSLGVRVREDDG